MGRGLRAEGRAEGREATEKTVTAHLGKTAAENPLGGARTGGRGPRQVSGEPGFTWSGSCREGPSGERLGAGDEDSNGGAGVRRRLPPARVQGGRKTLPGQQDLWGNQAQGRHARSPGEGVPCGDSWVPPRASLGTAILRPDGGGRGGGQVGELSLDLSQPHCGISHWLVTKPRSRDSDHL